jgi:hypothetical protein
MDAASVSCMLVSMAFSTPWSMAFKIFVEQAEFSFQAI